MNGLPRRANSWNFMDLMGALARLSLLALPLWQGPAGRQKGARAKAFSAQAYWFRERHSNPN